MWVSTSFSLALNFLPHQVRSAFQLSIRPPSSRMKRKLPCSAQGGTSSGLARYSLVAGSKECAEQRRRQAATKPIRPSFFEGSDTRGFPAYGTSSHHFRIIIINRVVLLIGLFSPF